jgi:hypothetical protein
MRKNLRKIPWPGLAFILVSLPGWALAMGLPFPSLPPVVEAEGMGNALVADGTLFNATAYNPALLQNHSDFGEVHLGFNLGNDLFGIVNYVTNSGDINNLQNSLQNVSPSFNDITNALNLSQNGGTVNLNEYNKGVTGLQNAVNNIQTAISNFTDKTLQVGAGLQVAFKIDDNWGFQAYNTSQAAFQVSRGGLVQNLLNLAALPTMPNSSNQAVTAAAVSMYNNTSTIINAFLTPSEQQQLVNAVTTLKNSSGSNTDIQNFANSVSGILSSVSSQISQQTLFNDIAPMTALVYSDTVLMATYCTRPLESDGNLTTGINLKAVNRRIASINSPYLAAQNTSQFSDIGNDLKNDIQQSTWRWGMDLGVLYNFDDPQIAVGASATDLLHSTATLNTSPGDPLYGLVTDSAPTVVRVGASCKVISELTVNADYDDLFSNTSYFQGLDAFSHVDFGFNYNLWGILQLRGGFTNDNFCGGLGLPLGIQYAFAVDNLTQSYNHYLQFDVAF